MKAKVHKVELFIVEFNSLTGQDVGFYLENANYPNDCIAPSVKHVVSKEIEWSDDHPLNNLRTQDAAYRELFNKD